MRALIQALYEANSQLVAEATELNRTVESITRDRMVKALQVEEGSWQVDDLRGASEAFLASTTREIQAVAAVDGQAFDAAPGPRTREAQDAFAETLGRELREL